MFRVEYFNTIMKKIEYRSYPFMDIHRVRTVAKSYAKSKNFKVVSITKVY